jgi:HlyD family secretion protein
VKHVQHREGGIVREILVKDGDVVKAGSVLVRLDDTAVRTTLAAVVGQLVDLKATRARLVAERDGKDRIDFPPSEYREAPKDLAEIEAGQTMLMKARRISMANRKQQLEEQVRQLEKQISGLDAQRRAKQNEVALLDEELAGVSTLIGKKLVTKNRITSLKRDRAKLLGEHGELVSQIAGLHRAISERRAQIVQLDEERRAEILQALQDVWSRIAELEEKRLAIDDERSRLEIRAPRSGTVHQMAVHTIGGVIAPGETVLQIVPREDVLVIEAKVSPADIDQLYVDQQATIRFPGLDHRTTPRINAHVQTIAADQTADEATQAPYYAVRLVMPDSEVARLKDQKLVQGMPVEAFITTANRTVLSYLTKPIVDQIAHAMNDG